MLNNRKDNNRISKITECVKTTISPLIKPIELPFQPRNILSLITIANINSYLGAHVARGSSSHIHFDSDAVEILDSGCSYTISFCREDFINFKPSKGQVEGLGIHNIEDKGTLNYTVIDNNGEHINISIKNTLYVPSLHTRLFSLQQLAQKHEDNLVGAHILGDALHLR